MLYFIVRFHNPSEEKGIGRDVVPPLSDDVQLSVEEYRSKLYEVSMCNGTMMIEEGMTGF